jgi:hypothetical protein
MRNPRVTVGRSLRLKYRTRDNTHRTRERITVSRNGNVVERVFVFPGVATKEARVP